MMIEIIVRAPQCPVLVTQTTEFRQPFGTGEQYTKSEITTRVDQGSEQTFFAYSCNSIRIDPLPPEVAPAPLFDYGALGQPVAPTPTMPSVPGRETSAVFPFCTCPAVACPNGPAHDVECSCYSPEPDDHDGGELDISGERRAPTHYCNICGADWKYHPPTLDEEEGWTLLSAESGKCCGHGGNRHLRVKAYPEAETDITAHDAADGAVVVEAALDYDGEAIDPDLRA